MESKTLSPSPDNADAKAAFRKPSNDAANRKYRRRSPVSGSSSSDGSPAREHSSSPIYSRDNPTRDSESWRRNGNRRDLEKDSGRSYRGRSGDSYRNSDRQSSRNSHNYHRRDDYSRHEKLRDDTRRESEHYKSRDPSCGDDKYSRYRSDGSGNRSRDKDKGGMEAVKMKRGNIGGVWGITKVIFHLFMENIWGIGMTQLHEGMGPNIAQKKLLIVTLENWMVINIPKRKRRNLMIGKLADPRTGTI